MTQNALPIGLRERSLLEPDSSMVRQTGRSHVAILHPLDTAACAAQDNLAIVGRRAVFVVFLLWTRPKRNDCQVTSRHASPTPCFQPGRSYENRPSRPFV
jgi:hypothetical protein